MEISNWNTCTLGWKTNTSAGSDNGNLHWLCRLDSRWEVCVRNVKPRIQNAVETNNLKCSQNGFPRPSRSFFWSQTSIDRFLLVSDSIVTLETVSKICEKLVQLSLHCIVAMVITKSTSTGWRTYSTSMTLQTGHIQCANFDAYRPTEVFSLCIGDQETGFQDSGSDIRLTSPSSSFMKFHLLLSGDPEASDVAGVGVPLVGGSRQDPNRQTVMFSES